MSTFIQALHRAEQARRRHRQERQQSASAPDDPVSSPPNATDPEPDIPLLDLASAIRLGQQS